MGTAESRTSLELKHKMKSSKEGDNCMSLRIPIRYISKCDGKGRDQSPCKSSPIASGIPAMETSKVLQEQCFDSAVRNLQSGSTMERCTKSWKGLGRKMLK